MITRKTAFVVGDKVFATLEQAQKAELMDTLCFEQDHACGMDLGTLADAILRNKDRVVDILTTKETSLPAARRINGGRKARKNGTPTPDVAKTLNA
jgi:hypothetical protein